MLAIRIQPDEGIALNFGSKLPGPAMEIAPVSMEFRYGSSFGVEPPEAYERLLLDCLLGDGTLFTRADEVEASWAWVSRIHRRWAEETPRPAAARCHLPRRHLGTARGRSADGRRRARLAAALIMRAPALSPAWPRCGCRERGAPLTYPLHATRGEGKRQRSRWPIP